MTATHTLHALHKLRQPPTLYDPGEPIFWNDPHISQGLLEAHLSPDTEAASRHPATIDAIVNRLLEYLNLPAGAAWLDMGCGPGLYTSRLAQRGLHVTGMDFSERSLAYAREYATDHDLTITYRYQNYLTLEDTAQYDVVSLIYGDFCPLFPAARTTLLANVRRALKPGGRFVFDVSAPACHPNQDRKFGWSAHPEGGFWMAEPHLLLEQGFAYPDDLNLDQHVIVGPEEKITVYRFWHQDYTPARITDELAAHGFTVRGLWGDLTGKPYTPDSRWIGIVATCD